MSTAIPPAGRLTAGLAALTLALSIPAARGQAGPGTAATPNDAVTVIVLPGERQTFAGFGSSLANFNGYYGKLPRAQRDELSRLVWHDLRFRTLRLWMMTPEYAPTPGTHDLTTFRRTYLDSGVIADAQRFGATTLLLAPDHVPDGMQEKRADGTVWLKPSENANYARLLAEFIAQLKAECGVTLDATGVQNEPSDEQRFAPAQIADIVARLRAELDARGLRQVKIIASENASANAVFADEVRALQANPPAWQALAGLASHSYNMAVTEPIAALDAGPHGENLREYWMTESGEGGHEEPGDVTRAMNLSGRVLNDLNHRVTHWIHFLAYENVRADGNGACLLTFTNEPPKITRFLPFDTFQQLSDAFDLGARLRHCQSSREKEMEWTYGKKPRLTAAAARNPDGSWAIGLVNYTADNFGNVAGWEDARMNASQDGYTPAQALNVTVEVPELKDRAPMVFTVRRTDAASANAAGPSVTMNAGRITLPVDSLELVTLRSAADPAPR